MKVVRFAVDDYRFADDLIHMEAVCENAHIGFSMVGQQRWQIPRMAGMGRSAGVEMAAGIGEALPVAAFPLVDVKGKETCFRLWKPCHLCLNQDTVPSLKESHNAPQSRTTAPNLRNGTPKNFLRHFIAPYPFYAHPVQADHIFTGVGIVLLLVSLKKSANS